MSIQRFSVWLWVTVRLLLDRPTRAHAGQTATETALVIAFVAVICIPAYGVLREAFAGVYLAHQVAMGGPVATSTPVP